MLLLVKSLTSLSFRSPKNAEISNLASRALNNLAPCLAWYSLPKNVLFRGFFYGIGSFRERYKKSHASKLLPQFKQNWTSIKPNREKKNARTKKEKKYLGSCMLVNFEKRHRVTLAFSFQ